jgi:hypothetical protein
MTKTAFKSMSDIIQLSELFAEEMPKQEERSKNYKPTDDGHLNDIFGDNEGLKISTLYDMWNIVINRDYDLFEEWIHIVSVLTKDRNKEILLKTEYLELQKLERAASIEVKSCQLLINIMFHHVDKNARTYEPKDIENRALKLEESYRKHAATVQNLANVCERLRDWKIEYTRHSNIVDPIMNRMITLAMTSISSVAIEYTGTDSVDKYETLLLAASSKSGATVDRSEINKCMTFLAGFTAMISIAYDELRTAKSKKLIKQALDYTCSIDTDLAKRVIKVHGNLTHVLANGEQCQLCQP